MSQPDDTQSFLIAAVVIAVLAVSAFGLTRFGADATPRHTYRASAGRASSTAAEKSGKPAERDRRRTPRLSSKQLHAIRADGRRRYAAELDLRFRRRDFAARVSTGGPRETVLEFGWREDVFDHLHMERLKKGLAMRKELRRLGFQRVQMRVGEKVVWETTIASASK
jgi:hypothetical protein